jgi:fructose-1,6-bisphosphatase II
MIRITTAGAVGAALHIGKGDPDKVDQTALDFSSAVLNQTEVDGEVICCEGPKDNAPAFSYMRKSRHRKRSQSGIRIDQVDGTTATSKGKKDAISALCLCTSRMPSSVTRRRLLLQSRNKWQS